MQHLGGRKVSKVAGQVQGKNGQEPKKKKSTVVSNKKKWTVMNPIWRQMKKCTPSSGQNDQLVHWWLLVHFAQTLGPYDTFVNP